MLAIAEFGILNYVEENYSVGNISKFNLPVSPLSYVNVAINYPLAPNNNPWFILLPLESIVILYYDVITNVVGDTGIYITISNEF